MEHPVIQKRRDYGTKDELVQHLKKNGITVPDDRQLLHTGYYHGYKGYRFFPGNMIVAFPFPLMKKFMLPLPLTHS